MIRALMLPHQMMAPSLSCRHGFSEGGSGWGRAQEMRAGVLGVRGWGPLQPPPSGEFLQGLGFPVQGLTLVYSGLLFVQGQSWKIWLLGGIRKCLLWGEAGILARVQASLKPSWLPGRSKPCGGLGTLAGSQPALLSLLSSPQPVSGGVCSSAHGSLWSPRSHVIQSGGHLSTSRKIGP